jgi:hypothetical protein
MAVVGDPKNVDLGAIVSGGAGASRASVEVVPTSRSGPLELDQLIVVIST